MTVTPVQTFPKIVTECYVTSDQKLHTSAEAADVHQSALNAEAARVEQQRIMEESRRFQRGRVESLLDMARVAGFDHTENARRGRFVVTVESLMRGLEVQGYKLVHPTDR